MKSNKDRLTPKAPVYKDCKSLVFVDHADGHGEVREDKWADWVCPNCGWFVGEQYIPRRHNQQKCYYCAQCGQAIDWEAADDVPASANHIADGGKKV